MSTDIHIPLKSAMETDQLPANVDAERTLLGSILLDNDHYAKVADGLKRSDDFFLSSHRIIFRAMGRLSEQGKPIDTVTLTEELARQREVDMVGGVAYLASLTDGLPRRQNISAWIDIVREKATLRLVLKEAELMTRAAYAPNADLDAINKQIAALNETVINYGRRADDWRLLFHSYEDALNAPPLRFAIEGFLQEDAITIIGGLAGHGKTFVMLNMVKSLLDGRELFNYMPFKPTRQSDRVIYLIPESALSPFVHRLRLFNLLDHHRDGRLCYRTLSSKEPLASLEDPRILRAAERADIYLDTAIRFMEGDENNAEDGRRFARVLFNLQQAGAQTITGAHHSPKNLGHAQFLTLENVLRGSGDIGAMVATCWGIYQTDAAANEIVIKNVKARDFQPCDEFRIHGRPWLEDKGYFQITREPGFGEPFNPQQERGKKGGRPQGPSDEDKFAQAMRLLEAGETVPEVAKQLEVSQRTIQRWKNGSKKVQ